MPSEQDALGTRCPRKSGAQLVEREEGQVFLKVRVQSRSRVNSFSVDVSRARESRKFLFIIAWVYTVVTLSFSAFASLIIRDGISHLFLTAIIVLIFINVFALAPNKKKRVIA